MLVIVNQIIASTNYHKTKIHQHAITLSYLLSLISPLNYSKDVSTFL